MQTEEIKTLVWVLRKAAISQGADSVSAVFFCVDAIANWVLERCVRLKCERLCVSAD